VQDYFFQMQRRYANYFKCCDLGSGGYGKLRLNIFEKCICILYYFIIILIMPVFWKANICSMPSILAQVGFSMLAHQYESQKD